MNEAPQSATPILSSFLARRSVQSLNIVAHSYETLGDGNGRNDWVQSRPVLSRTIFLRNGGKVAGTTIFLQLTYTRYTLPVSPFAYVSDPRLHVKRRQLPLVSCSLPFLFATMAGPGRFITRNCYGLRSVPLATQVQYHFHNDASHPSPHPSAVPQILSFPLALGQED